MNGAPRGNGALPLPTSCGVTKTRRPLGNRRMIRPSASVPTTRARTELRWPDGAAPSSLESRRCAIRDRFDVDFRVELEAEDFALADVFVGGELAGACCSVPAAAEVLVCPCGPSAGRAALCAAPAAAIRVELLCCVAGAVGCVAVLVSAAG